MKRMWLHRICAYPNRIAWFFGALIINAFLIFSLVASWGDLATLLYLNVLLWFLLLLIPASLLGFLAVIPFGFSIGRFCDYMNGAPFEMGEKVVILRGPYVGQETQVLGFTEGQGGVKLLVLDLGEDADERFLNRLEECHVTRVKRLTTCSPESHPSHP